MGIDDTIRVLAVAGVMIAGGLGLLAGGAWTLDRVHAYRTRNEVRIGISDSCNDTYAPLFRANQGERLNVHWQVKDEDGIAKVGIYKNGQNIQMMDFSTSRFSTSMSSRFEEKAEDTGEIVYSVRGIDRKNNPTNFSQTTLIVNDPKYAELPKKLD